MTYPAETGISLDYTYDDENRLTTIKWGSTTLAQYGYDDLDRLTGISRGNGTYTSYISYTYDLADQVTEVVHTLTNDQTLSYSYPEYDKGASHQYVGRIQALFAASLNESGLMKGL